MVNQAAIAFKALTNLQVGIGSLVDEMSTEFQEVTGGSSLLSERFFLKTICSIVESAIEKNKENILSAASENVYETHDLFTLAINEKVRTSLDEKALRIAHEEMIPLLEEYRKRTPYVEVSVKAR